jgi:hypothetical protein
MQPSLVAPLSSYYALGLSYEQHVIHALKLWNMKLIHSGQSQDRGVDFYGTWTLPDTATLSVIGQCKNSYKPLGPRYLREWEGVLSHESQVLRGLGILVTTCGYTRNLITHFYASSYPLMLLSLMSDSIHPTSIQLNLPAHHLLPNVTIGRVYDYGKFSSRPILCYRQQKL